MRRILLIGSAILALVGASSSAQATVLRFEGLARIQLHEVLVHGDPYTLDTTAVDLRIELNGPEVLTLTTNAVGTATIERGDGSVTTVPLFGQMWPPRGGGGFAGATGIGDDGGLYCFQIWDQVDAPTPRPDRLVAAFEPLDRVAEGHLQDIVEGLTTDPTRGIPFVPTDNCYPMEYRYAAPISGDFWFSSVV